jgi:hypothetical protein
MVKATTGSMGTISGSVEELDSGEMEKATTGSMGTISGSVEELDSGEMGRAPTGSMGTTSGSEGELDCGGIETTGSILGTISGSVASNHSYSGEAKASGVPSILQGRQIQVEK